MAQMMTAPIITMLTLSAITRPLFRDAHMKAGVAPLEVRPTGWCVRVVCEVLDGRMELSRVIVGVVLGYLPENACTAAQLFVRRRA